jgi:GntR family transcriptional regulator of arabinose operon
MALTSSPRPTKYVRLADTLREQINRSVLHPGDRLPSLSELCAQYDTSLGTVNRALGILEQDGLIVRVNGSGVFVTEPTTSRETKSDKPLLGLIIPFCHGEFFSPIIQAVQKECRAAGYLLIVANSLNDEALEAQLLQQLSNQTDGLCVMPCGPGNQAAFAALLEQRTPFVLLDRQVEGLKVSLVSTDNERGGYLATRHLLDSGCRRVYTIGKTSARISTLRDRIVGFRRALTEAGVPFDPSLVRQADGNTTQLGYFLTKELLTRLGENKREQGKIGLFALNEHTTPGCYMAIKERGLRIPGDVAVVGFDDINATIFDPPLTAVRQDLTGMGREGVRQLLEIIRVGSAIKPRQTRLQPELIVRNSSDANSDFCSIRQMQQNPVPSNLFLNPLPPLVGV